MSKFIQRGLLAALLLLTSALAVVAAPYAALVMDARTGKVLHARNHDTRLHPASLTKMMTLYIAFEAVERGEITLDTKVTISKAASREPPVKLGLRAGQKVKLRYLIRAAAVKSANDAATAIAEAISGSEKAFARRMNATAKAMGMTKTTFKNAHGLTQSGHLSTARDMANLGRRLFYDHPDYYNIFARVSTSAGTRKVFNTNRRFLRNYRGADGIKTGYTRAAGYNLVGSARRGNERIIASLFGGKSTAWRTKRMAELLDMGFARAPSGTREIKPGPLDFVGTGTAIASARKQGPKKLNPVLSRALPPMQRPGGGAESDVAALVARAYMDTEIDDAVRRALAAADEQMASMKLRVPPSRRDHLRGQIGTAINGEVPQTPTEVAIRTGAKRNWSVHLGTYTNRREAERQLLVTALQEVTALDGAYRRIEPLSERGKRVFRARFVGLTQRDAERACARLSARSATCVPLSPGT